MLIGLTGLAGSGKDTVGRHLAERYGFEVVSFAEPIYAAVSSITGLSVEALSDREQKETPLKTLGRSPRELLQSLGTEWGRQMVCEDIWVNICVDRCRRITAKGGSAVITDVRFDNEAMAIKLDGGEVWRISRPGEHSCVGDSACHSSEKGVSDVLVDEEIVNDASVDYLRARADYQLLQYKNG